MGNCAELVSIGCNCLSGTLMFTDIMPLINGSKRFVYKGENCAAFFR